MPFTVGISTVRNLLMGSTPVSKIMQNGQEIWPLIPVWPGPSPYCCVDFSKLTIDPQGTNPNGVTAQLTRASAATVLDFEGNTVTVLANMPRFQGARYVKNLVFNSSAVASYVWKTTRTANVDQVNGIVYNGYASADGTRMDIQFQPAQINAPAWYQGITFTVSCYIKKAPGSRDASFLLRIMGTDPPITINIDHEDPRRYSFTRVTLQAGNYLTFQLQQSFGTNNIDTNIHIGGLVVEEVTGQSNQNPSEYVATTGTPVIRAFDCLNGNTVAANGVVTEAQGARISNIVYLDEAVDTLTFAAIPTPNQAIFDRQVTVDWNGIVPNGTHSRLTVFAPPLDATDLNSFISQDWSCS